MKPTFIQHDPSIERRRRLAEEMMANRKTGPVRTGMEGAARIAEQLVAGYQLGKARKDQAAWDEAARKDLARIMSDYQNDVRPLSQHPGTADIATQIQLSQMEADKAAEAANAARVTGLEDYILKKQVDQQYPGQQKGTTAMQNAAAMGYQPGTPEYIEYIRSTTKKGPLVQIGGAAMTKGDVKADEKFSDEYQKWISGDFADVRKSINQLEEVSKQLADPKKNLTGPGVGLTPDVVLERLNPEAVATREAVEEIVQRNLRLVLGAQFTEKEGERLIKRAYNPSLSEAENKKRVDRLLRQIRTAAKAKQAAVEYFAEHGTLKGFAGKIFTMSDFYDSLEGPSPSAKRPTQAEIEAEIKRRGL